MNIDINTSSLQQSSLKVIGMVDHTFLDRDNLIIVQATSINRSSSDEEEGAQADHSHSTLSTPDRADQMVSD